MVIDFATRRIVPTESTTPPEREVKVSLINTTFIDPTPKKRSHAAEPLKRLDDIYKIQDYLIGANRYRDNLLFVCGINFGLRAGDLLQLKIGHLLNEDGKSYRDSFTVQEGKTGKYRQLFLNAAVMEAADLYFSEMEEADLNDYLFKSKSNNHGAGKPLLVRSVEDLLKEIINDKCHINVHASTHCLRKTFAYHVITTAKDRPRAVEFLQKILGHSSQATTLFYAGITDEEIKDTYLNLSLGRGYDVGKSSGLEEASTPVDSTVHCVG